MSKTKNKNNNENDESNKLPIPRRVLDQINEYTVGGFVIFFFDAETGQPNQLMAFDSPACALALQKHISNWLQTIDEINIENSVQNIKEMMERDNDEDNNK